MRRLSMGLVVVVVLVIALAVPQPVRGWGMDVHRFITGRVIDSLPDTIRPFFAAKREFISEHSADPDLWRVMALKGELGEEDPNHFFDIDMFDDPPPFKNVPRAWDAFVAKYGLERANKAGRLPWRIEEVNTKLVTTFTDIGKGTAPYAADNSRYLVAVLSHYLEDAHVPFHATTNYDGLATNQRGIHARFETELVLQNVSKLKLTPVVVRPIANIRDFAFDTLIEGQALVAAVLEADRKAIVGREFYDEGYYAAFAPGALPIAEKRISQATSAVASAIVSAWERAGKPALPMNTVRPPARIPRDR
jgi:hypothetical protein